LPTALLALPRRETDAMALVLRTGEPAVVPRVQEGRVVLDLRTVAPGEIPHLARRLEQVLAAIR